MLFVLGYTVKFAQIFYSSMSARGRGQEKREGKEEWEEREGMEKVSGK